MESRAKEAVQILLQLLPADGEGFSIERVKGGVDVIPKEEDSFPIHLRDEGDEVTVTAGEWHEHLSNPEQAAFCVMWLLSPYYRIVELYDDDALLVAFLERFEQGAWETYTSVYFTDPEIMRTANRRVRRQQAVLRPPQGLLDAIGVEGEDLPPDSVLGIHSTEIQETIWFSREDLSEEDQSLERASNTSDPLARLYDLLDHETDKYSLELEDHRIRVNPVGEENFWVELSRTSDGFQISALGCSYVTENPEQALWGTVYLLAGTARLVISHRGETRLSIWIEHFEDGAWTQTWPKISRRWWTKFVRPNRLLITQQKLPLHLVLQVDEGVSLADEGLDEDGLPLDSYWGTKEVRI